MKHSTAFPCPDGAAEDTTSSDRVLIRKRSWCDIFIPAVNDGGLPKEDRSMGMAVKKTISLPPDLLEGKDDLVLSTDILREVLSVLARKFGRDK